MCPLSGRAGFLIKSVSPLHGAPMETKLERFEIPGKYWNDTCGPRVSRMETVITNLAESRGILLFVEEDFFLVQFEIV